MNKLTVSLCCLLVVISIASCQKNVKSEIERKWKMQGEDVRLEIKHDGTYIYSEHNRSKSGKWELKDNTTIIFNGQDSSDNDNLTIKRIEGDKLILEGNGDIMDFRAE